MPEFPGGEEALFKHIHSNVLWSPSRNDSVINGKVIVSFVIGKDGQIKDPRILKAGKGTEGLQKEIIRVILAMPRWNPGRMNGTPVDIMYYLPVTIELR
ncbi:MAG: energy transducer TonB [Bacteroidia bacterium]